MSLNENSTVCAKCLKNKKVSEAPLKQWIEYAGIRYEYTHTDATTGVANYASNVLAQSGVVTAISHKDYEGTKIGAWEKSNEFISRQLLKFFDPAGNTL